MRCEASSVVCEWEVIFLSVKGPMGEGFTKTDTFLIFPCFLEAWAEINALIINDS